MSGTEARAEPARGEPLAGTRLLAGIDEAGLGPLLGPLAIGWSVLRVPVPAGATEVNPWKLLSPTVGKRPGKRARLLVADSKKLFHQDAIGLKRLETTALAFLALLAPDRVPPASARAVLFRELAPESSVLDRHPWYARLPAVPAALEPPSLELSISLLARRMRERGVELVGAGVRLVPSGEFNASLSRTRNKGATAWEATREVVRHLWTRHRGERPFLMIDMLGGRVRYAGLLEAALGSTAQRLRVNVLSEAPECSSYEVEDEASGHAMRIDFRTKGEDASFCVALASCLAKYARELEMLAFNLFFGERDASLRPTAGYTADGRRWLREAARAIESAGVDRALLVRQR
jgi:ribonuclease HII